jgi:hypothetical protein
MNAGEGPGTGENPSWAGPLPNSGPPLMQLK